MIDTKKAREMRAKGTQGEWVVEATHLNAQPDRRTWRCVSGKEQCSGTLTGTILGRAESNTHLIAYAVNALAPMADEIDRLREATAWRPIETAPKDGTEVLLHWPHWTDKPVIGGFFDGDWECEVALVASVGPTHWLPLPCPPKPD